MTWADRPADLDKPGHIPRSDEWEALLDRMESLSPVITAYTTADTSRSTANTGSTYTDDPYLSAQVDANGVYEVYLRVVFQAPTAADIKQRFVLPSGTLEASFFRYNSTAPTTTTLDWRPTGTAGELTGAVGSAGNQPLEIEGTLFVGSTGGTLAWQWAQDVANATSTIVRKGSRLRLVKMN